MYSYQTFNIDPSGDSIKIDRLNDGKDWDEWKFKIQERLKAANLLDVVTGKIIKTIQAVKQSDEKYGEALSEFNRRDYKAQLIIVTALGRQPKLHLLQCETSHQMWSKLELLYERNSSNSWDGIAVLEEIIGQTAESFSLAKDNVRNEGNSESIRRWVESFNSRHKKSVQKTRGNASRSTLSLSTWNEKQSHQQSSQKWNQVRNIRKNRGKNDSQGKSSKSCVDLETKIYGKVGHLNIGETANGQRVDVESIDSQEIFDVLVNEHEIISQSVVLYSTNKVKYEISDHREPYIEISDCTGESNDIVDETKRHQEYTFEDRKIEVLQAGPEGDLTESHVIGLLTIEETQGEPMQVEDYSFREAVKVGSLMAVVKLKYQFVQGAKNNGIFYEKNVKYYFDCYSYSDQVDGSETIQFVSGFGFNFGPITVSWWYSKLMKHMDIMNHFIRERYRKGLVEITYGEIANT